MKYQTFSPLPVRERNRVRVLYHLINNFIPESGDIDNDIFIFIM
jgi:hypothetical protein